MGSGQSETKSLKATEFSFQEAASVFGDPFSITVSRSGSFYRGTAVYHRWNVKRRPGIDRGHADRNENIRIISARKTTRGEREQYEGKN